MVSTGRPDGEVLRIVVIFRMVGPIGLKGSTMVLMTKYQKLKVAIKSSWSRLTSIVEILMALKMPSDFQSSPKWGSIRLT